MSWLREAVIKIIEDFQSRIASVLDPAISKLAKSWTWLNTQIRQEIFRQTFAAQKAIEREVNRLNGVILDRLAGSETTATADRADLRQLILNKVSGVQRLLEDRFKPVTDALKTQLNIIDNRLSTHTKDAKRALDAQAVKSADLVDTRVAETTKWAMGYVADYVASWSEAQVAGFAAGLVDGLTDEPELGGG